MGKEKEEIFQPPECVTIDDDAMQTDLHIKLTSQDHYGKVTMNLDDTDIST
jgi:hypothetical protein